MIEKNQLDENETRINRATAILRKHEHTGVTPAKPVEILLTQIHQTMSTNSLLHIGVGNSTDLRGSH